jgi:hypothetical protein
MSNRQKNTPKDEKPLILAEIRKGAPQPLAVGRKRGVVPTLPGPFIVRRNIEIELRTSLI